MTETNKTIKVYIYTFMSFGKVVILHKGGGAKEPPGGVDKAEGYFFNKWYLHIPIMIYR